MCPTVTRVNTRENKSTAVPFNTYVMSAMQQENDEEDDQINKESMTVTCEEESEFVQDF